MFFIISVLAQMIASPPPNMSCAGVTVNETGRPQLELTMLCDGSVLGKKQCRRLALLIAKCPNKVISSLSFS